MLTDVMIKIDNQDFKSLLAGQLSSRGYQIVESLEDTPNVIVVTEEKIDSDRSVEVRFPCRIGEVLDQIEMLNASAYDNVNRTLVLGDDSLIDLHDLSMLEARLINVLADYKGETVDRQVLLKKVWGYQDSIETHTLETNIYRLRRKIEKDPAQPVNLLTKKNGYALLIQN